MHSSNANGNTRNQYGQLINDVWNVASDNSCSENAPDKTRREAEDQGKDEIEQEEHPLLLSPRSSAEYCVLFQYRKIPIHIPFPRLSRLNERSLSEKRE
jgi:hypothetical protein